ncbi:hypothetical protein GZL_05493 [Streptomyces sp. 769]|nr:hypothetical protein GZL_05493 [Streptomyces sp. 769]
MCVTLREPDVGAQPAGEVGVVLHGAYGTKSAQFRAGGREGCCRVGGKGTAGWEGRVRPGRKGGKPRGAPSGGGTGTVVEGTNAPPGALMR